MARSISGARSQPRPTSGFCTHNGSILTDFNDSVLKTKSEGKGYGGADAAHMGADAARATADAVRMAAQVAWRVCPAK